MSAVPIEIDAWRSSGRELEIFGRRVFARVEGVGPGEPVLYLHGFPTSSFDLRQAAPLLARGRRVVMHDHLGFGLSEKPADYSYSLLEQAEVAIAVWKSLGVESGHLVAHDYGTSVAAELCARAVRGMLPFKLRSVTFCNGSMILELAKLRITQRLLRSKTLGPLFARIGSYRMFRLQMRRILGDPDSIPDSEWELHWWLIRHDDGRERLSKVSSYLDERQRFRSRWIDSLPSLGGLGVPLKLVWGNRDPIAVPAIPERVASQCGVQVQWLEGLGHYPMLEDAPRWSAAIEEALPKNG